MVAGRMNEVCGVHFPRCETLHRADAWLGASLQMTTKPDSPSDKRWRIPMKSVIRAALAALSLATITPVANAANFHNGSTIAGTAQATRMQQSGSYGG